MSTPADELPPPDEQAPFGYMRDPGSGEVRPKKRPGFTGQRGARKESPDGPAEAEGPDLASEDEGTELPEGLAKDPEPRRGQGVIRDASNKRSPVRVTPAVRKDIRAKTALFLSIPAAMWKRRDPVCGSVAAEVVPDTADALADIFCDSPDLVAFFTSTGGGYMKWLTLATTLQPLAEVVFRHHVSHTISDEENEGSGPPVPRDWSRYAAPAL